VVNADWQPRRSGAGMRWDMNLSEIAQLIGTVYGAEKAVRTNVYIDHLMRAAHAEAAGQFNKDIAAQAIATQRFNHMYEWGTAGINKGRTTRRMNPLNPEAMLWKHRLTGGRGKVKGIDWEYRASKVPVPQPTTAKTKVEREFLDRLSGRKHIFYWKAPIIENGQKVKLRPKYAKMIFVPFYGQPRSPNLSEQTIKRGFLFHKGPLTNVPGHGTIQGRDLRGNFTSFWEDWWNNAGEKILSEKMYAEVDESIRVSLEKAGKAGTGRARKKGFQFEIMTAEVETAKWMQARAKALQQQEEMENEVW